MTEKKKTARRTLTPAEWGAIRDAYVVGEVDDEGKRRHISYAALAKNFGVNHVTVGKRGAREGWVRLREQHEDRVREETIEISAKKIGADGAAMNIDAFNIVRMLLHQMYRNLERYTGVDPETNEARPPLAIADLKDLATTASNLLKTGRLASGQSTDNRAIEAEIKGGVDPDEIPPVRLVVTDPEVIAEAQRILARTLSTVDPSGSTVPALLPPETDGSATRVP